MFPPLGVNLLAFDNRFSSTCFTLVLSQYTLKEVIRQTIFSIADNDNNKLQDSVNDINSKIDEEEKIKKDEVEVYQSWKKLKETLTEALSH